MAYYTIVAASGLQEGNVENVNLYIYIYIPINNSIKL